MHTSHKFVAGSPIGVFTPGKIYNRVDGFTRDGRSRGFYIDDRGEFRLTDDDMFEPAEQVQLRLPQMPMFPARQERLKLAARWGTSEISISNWYKVDDLMKPWRISDAICGTRVLTEPNTATFKPGELAELANSRGYLLSELSVRWGWHYGCETLHTISTDPRRVALIWDMLEGMNRHD